MKKKTKRTKRKRQPAYGKARRNHKDTVFRMLFKDPKELLELYNSVNGSDYSDPGILEINTLENAIYVNVKNDISFVLDCTLNLYEHESTVNPNITLRMLDYVTDVLRKLLWNENLYGSKRIQIPTPRFVVFYNGTEEQPDRMEYRLSSNFQKQVDRPELELIVTVLNINKGKNKELMSRCRTLEEYAYFIDLIREYALTMEPQDAVQKAVDECIRLDILKEFLQKNKAEVIAVNLYEFDEKAYRRTIREEAKEEGRIEGREVGLREGREVGLREGREVGLREGREAGRVEGRKLGHEEGRQEGLQEGRQEEMANTERERLRAEKAEKRIRELEQENMRLRTLERKS